MPAFEQLLQTLLEYIKDHAVKLLTGLVLMALGWYFGQKRASADWKKQEFLDRLNMSLNTIENGVLKIRTLSEKRCEDVFLNTAAVEIIRKVATKTTEANPILPMPEEETWFYLNSVLNDLSEQFAAGLLKRDLGGNVLMDTYLIALTCEVAGSLKTRKIRAMVIKKSLLTNLPKEPPKFENDRHGVRWDTLQCLAREYAKSPGLFKEVELGVA